MNGITIAEFQTVLSGAGFLSELVHEEEGLAVLRVSVRHLVFITVLQGEVSKGHFGSVQCLIGFHDEFSIAQANEWNQSRRFTRVYIMEDGGPMLEMDFLTVGITAQTVQAYLGLWLMSLHEFGEMFA